MTHARLQGKTVPCEQLVVCPKQALVSDLWSTRRKDYPLCGIWVHRVVTFERAFFEELKKRDGKEEKSTLVVMLRSISLKVDFSLGPLHSTAAAAAAATHASMATKILIRQKKFPLIMAPILLKFPIMGMNAVTQ